MSQSTPPIMRRWVFRAILLLSIVVSVTLQLRTGSDSRVYAFIPVGVVVLYMMYAIVRARRARRASGAPRPPRIKTPLSFKLLALAVALGALAMLALNFSQADETLAGTRWGGLLKAAEAIFLVLVLVMVQWQRTIVRRQRGDATGSQTARW